MPRARPAARGWRCHRIRRHRAARPSGPLPWLAVTGAGAALALVGGLRLRRNGLRRPATEVNGAHPQPAVIAFAVGLMLISGRHCRPAADPAMDSDQGRRQLGQRPCPRPGSSSGTIRSAESKKRLARNDGRLQQDLLAGQFLDPRI